jgi:cation diffusion facilitator CzcD-associated flavoprotein CzcO
LAPSVCIIGAGSSGISACQVLKDGGIPFECFEKGSEVGGNWRYLNDNGMSSSYESLFINTRSRSPRLSRRTCAGRPESGFAPSRDARFSRNATAQILD